VIWSNTAFNIWMGDAMAQAPEGARARDVMVTEASVDRDVMLANAARDRAIEEAAACEAAIEARRSGSLVARGARG
jgi:hypothetical protein